jgi:hypothetical protein
VVQVGLRARLVEREVRFGCAQGRLSPRCRKRGAGEDAVKGHIRFHVTSFDDGHVFARKLDWMIEDTLHEAER